MSTPRSPATIMAIVPTKSHISSMRAESKPGLLKTFPRRGKIPKKICSPLASPKSLWATYCPILVVDRIFDSQRIFIREESDVGLRLGQVVEHPSIGNTLTMGSNCSRREI